MAGGGWWPARCGVTWRVFGTWGGYGRDGRGLPHNTNHITTSRLRAAQMNIGEACVKILLPRQTTAGTS